MGQEGFQHLKEVRKQAGREGEEGLLRQEKTIPETMIEMRRDTAGITTPRVAIVIDDLGHNKESALRILDIKAPLTLSVLPRRTYSEWIAAEGWRRGHDVIGHIPMEAGTSNKLGEGGLYTWMTDQEIMMTLEDDLLSLPYIKGASNHMGSVFTEDERVMDAVLIVLKKKGLFFLDSLTTPRSVASKRGSEIGLIVLKRDIFLDNGSEYSELETQWRKLIERAQKNGFAVGLAHPRTGTIEFLEKKLPSTDVEVVPLSQVILHLSE